MKDRASGTLNKLTGSSFETMQKLTGLQEKVSQLNRNTKDFGGSIYTLKQKVDILQEERDLIDPSNLTKIRQYNKEIKGLTTTINNLENTTGGKFGKWAKDAVNQIPGAGLLTNPIVMAGAGVAAVGKLGVSWEEGMAKINATAQLPQQQLDTLSKKIKRLALDAGKDLRGVPDAYEKILSQTGDVALSTDILSKALKGAKAGFTEVNLVSGATAQSLSAIGKEKTNAQEVLDVLFGAKRVGAGEFADFARYLPTLFAAGNNIGAVWKETAGLFAYMTGKGQDAATSAMLIQNAYNALGKSDITDGLKKAGVMVYDENGKLRSMVEIFTDLSRITSAMTDQQRSDFLESIGLRDQQAKAAFSILTNETNKLKAAVDATSNASGELQAALDNTDNTGNKLREGWAKIQGIGLSLGNVVLTVLNPVLDVLGSLLEGISSVIDGVGAGWSWWMNMLQQGNPWIVGLTVLIGGLTTALIVHNIWLKRNAIWMGIVTAAKGVWAAVTGVATGAMWGLNAALLANPVTWIVIGIMALVAAFIAAWKHSEKFRGAITGIWEVIRDFGSMLKEFVIDRIKGILSGLTGIASAVKKLFNKDWKGAMSDGKKALADLVGVDAYKNAMSNGKQLGEKFRSGYQKGVESFANDKLDAGYVKDEKTGKWVKGNKTSSLIDKVTPTNQSENNVDIEELMKKLNKNKGFGKNSDDKLSLGIPQNYGKTNTYAAITAKLGVDAPEAAKQQNTTDKPVKTIAMRVDDISSSLKKMAAVAAVPLAMSIGAANANVQKLVPIDNKKVITTETTIAPVANSLTEGNVYNAFDNRLLDNSQQFNNVNSTVSTEENKLFKTIFSTADLYNESTNIENSGNNIQQRNSEVNKTDNQHNQTIHIDRFTDKIEIHVTGGDAPQEAAEQVRIEVEKALAEIFNV
ncbi:phage tail tape measure protein [uncultured Draconibacterium sp.]|uniref:phage tail tape measure protein n=1 Tax=uncultured Draconibacterium sp. TaxID=1573823 RepID=UPI0025DB542E|nr:phage tail tape measure protein [uncultured Draconibacterium sp.]